MRIRLCAIAAAIVGLLVGTVSASAASEDHNSPRHYYVALGDSLAYGYQQAKFQSEVLAKDVDANTFNTGYVDDFAAMLRTASHRVKTVNYGCPGETTVSYFVGCAFHLLGGYPLHKDYSGSQRDAALGFLNAHRGQVSLITLDNGANDVTACPAGPSFQACFFTAVGTVAAKLNQALAELRAAAPKAVIIVMQYYNPLYVVDPSTDGLEPFLNNAIASAALANGARLANAFPVINQNPAFPSEFAAVCGLTGMCVPPGGDVHPNDAGYAAIAQQFWQASGFAAEEDD